MPQKFQNLFDNIPAALPQEFFQTLAEKGKVRIERIVSEGHSTTKGEWCCQAWDEWVLLITGNATLLFESSATAVHLKPGDHLMIPAGCRHRVEWTEPNQSSIWLAVHFGETGSGRE